MDIYCTYLLQKVFHRNAGVPPAIDAIGDQKGNVSQTLVN
jgi:hypothetical protein